MCNPFIPYTCAGVIAGGAGAVDKAGTAVVDGIVHGLAEGFAGAVRWVAELLTLWILVPSNDLCPTSGDNPNQWSGDWMAQCAAAGGPAQELRGFLLPVTVLVAVGGLIWQGVLLAISRKGEPLIQALRGLWNLALWSAVGIAGPHLLLKAGDSYSMWILDEAIFKESDKPPNETMSAALGVLLLPGGPVSPVVMILVGLVVVVIALVQTILMVFREGSVVVLAGVVQLAAAGSITRGNSAALHKVVGWSLALGLYKPAAATVYATAFIMMRGNRRDFVMGLGMLVLSIVALPAMMKFFTIFTGQVASGGGGAGMLGAGAAAGMHAASSIQGAIGGNSAGDHARYMDTNGPGGRGGPGKGAGGSPTGATNPSPAGPGSGPGGGRPGSGKVVDGEATPGAAKDAPTRPVQQTTVAPGTGATAGTGPASGAASGGTGAASASAASGATAGTAGGAAAGGAAGGATAGAAAAGAATGPAAPVVVAGVVVAQAAAAAAKKAASEVDSATGEGK